MLNSPVGRGHVTNRLQVGDVGFLGNVRCAQKGTLDVKWTAASATSGYRAHLRSDCANGGSEEGAAAGYSHLAPPRCASDRLPSRVIRLPRCQIVLGHLSGSQPFLRRDDQEPAQPVGSILLPARTIPRVSPCPQVHGPDILRPWPGSGLVLSLRPLFTSVLCLRP
jgi:hypothetical protein